MKTEYFLTLLIGIILMNACQDAIIMGKLSDEVVVSQTRSITPTTSPWFDWEDTVSITSPFDGNIILPWYNMASVQLPDFVLKDYKKEDGWVLVYNTISQSPVAASGKNYLIFYNRFTGILRTYYNHTNSVGTATTTFWKVTVDRPLSILNASGYFTHPMDWRPTGPEVYVSTINTTPAKTIYRGWNCFDVELVYDDQLIASPARMSLAAYSKVLSEIKLKGGIELTSEGSIVTKGNSNPWIGPANIVLNNSVQGAGKVVNDSIDLWLKTKKMLPKIGLAAATAFATGGVSEALKYGINLLTGSFLGKFGNPTTTTQDLRFKTNGTAEFSGGINTPIGSEITTIANFVVPGSPATANDHFSPSFDEPLGVWNLKQQPVIKMSDIIQWRFERNLGGGVGEYAYNYRGIYLDNVLPVINREVAKDIERYEVFSEIVNYPIFNGETNWRGYGGSTSLPHIGGDLIYNNDESPKTQILRAPVPLPYTTNRHSTYRFIDDKCIYSPHLEQTTSIMNGNYVVKVTVILYPKHPYNTTPIVMTRSYLPRYEILEEYENAMRSLRPGDEPFSIEKGISHNLCKYQSLKFPPTLPPPPDSRHIS